MEINLKENVIKDKYGNRKRGDSWEGRISVFHQQVSLYDIDTRRLEKRKKSLIVKTQEFTEMQEEYRRIATTVQFITISNYENLNENARVLYNEIIKIINAKKECKFLNTINEIYKDIEITLSKLKGKSPEIQKKDNEKTVEEWFYEWLWTYKKGHKAKTTFRGYVSKTKNHIIRAFGNKKLSDVTTLEIQSFINDLMIEYSTSTVKQIYLLLQEGFSRAVKDKLIECSPVIDIEVPRVVSNIMEAVNLELEKKLIEIFANDEMCYPFAVLVDTGLRTSELCGVKWENVDFNKRVIYVRQSYQRVDEYDFIDGKIVKTGSVVEETELKSKTSRRTIPMSKGVYSILKDIYDETLNTDGDVNPKKFVFINTKGNPITGECLRDRLETILKNNDLGGISLHQFRHTFATRLYEAKVKLKCIQSLLGHSTVQMTERYLHIDKDAQSDSIAQLESYYAEVGLVG